MQHADPSGTYEPNVQLLLPARTAPGQSRGNVPTGTFPPVSMFRATPHSSAMTTPRSPLCGTSRSRRSISRETRSVRWRCERSSGASKSDPHRRGDTCWRQSWSCATPRRHRGEAPARAAPVRGLRHVTPGARLAQPQRPQARRRRRRRRRPPGSPRSTTPPLPRSAPR